MFAGNIKIVIVCGLLALGLGLGQGRLMAQGRANKSIENKQQQLNKLQDDINFLDRQIEQTKKKRQNTLTELSLLKKKADIRKQIIDKLNGSIQEQNRQIADKSEELALLQGRLDTLSVHYKRMVEKAYRNRDNRTWFMYVLASDNIEQGYRRYSYLKKYSSSLNEQAKKIKETQSLVETQKKDIETLQAENIKTQKTKTREYDKLRSEQKKSQAYANSLSKQQNKYQEELRKKRQQAAALNREIEKMIENAISADKKGGKKSAASASNVKLSGAFENNKGKLPWPVKGVITEGFGIHPHPTLKGVSLPFNNGVNISAPQASSVTAVYEGEVKQITFIHGYSNCVLIKHGKYFTFYCKLGKVNVKTGQKVSTGQVIGTLDTAQENSELHFELWNGTQKQNPIDWLRR